MALKRKRASSPTIYKNELKSRAQSNVHLLSPSSSTSWSSISSTASSSFTTSVLDEPDTPQSFSPTLNFKANDQTNRAFFDRYGTKDFGSSPIAMAVDTWRMDVNNNGHNGQGAFARKPSPSFEPQAMMDCDAVIDTDIDDNPSGRTRKRFRDNRPDERTIYENTLTKLFNAQRNAAQPFLAASEKVQQQRHQIIQHPPQRSEKTLQHSSPSASTPPPLSFSSSSSIPSSSALETPPPPSSSSSSNLDAFLGIATDKTDIKSVSGRCYSSSQRPPMQRLLPFAPAMTSAHVSSGTFTAFVSPIAASDDPSSHFMCCEDCDYRLLSEKLSATGEVVGGMMDVDGVTDVDSLQQEFACSDCGHIVCDRCAYVVVHRRCLACATACS